MAKEAKESQFSVSLKDLLEAGCHFGHQSRRWHPKMAPFIWQARGGVHIFDLVKTKEQLEKACGAVLELVAEGKVIVFVGTKRQAQAIVKEEAEKAGIPYVSNRWMGGLITNWGQVSKSIEKLVEMKEKKEKGEYDKYTKKENVLIDREISRLEKFFGGLAGLKQIPEAIFVVDIKKEKAAVKEAKMKGLKVFAIVDSNSDPTPVDYLIPVNDDAVRSIKLVVEKFAEAVKKGLELKEKKKRRMDK